MTAITQPLYSCVHEALAIYFYFRLINRSDLDTTEY